MRLKNRYEKLKSQNTVIVKAKLITGTEVVYLNNIVGFCHCYTHKGFLTKNLLRQHDCINKECPFLEKYRDYPFWEHFDRVQENLSKKKTEIKLKKKNAVIEKNAEQKQLNEMLEKARGIQDRLNYSIIITSIKKDDHQFDYVINYVSSRPRDDWGRYVPLALELRKIYGRTFRINHIKNVDGTYATITDYKSRRK